jgi:hypothetical protein
MFPSSCTEMKQALKQHLKAMGKLLRFPSRTQKLRCTGHPLDALQPRQKVSSWSYDSMHRGLQTHSKLLKSTDPQLHQ